MKLIKNFQTLATSKSRKVALELIESGLEAIQPESVMKNTFVKNGERLLIKDEEFDLSKYKRIFSIGFGKGSAKVSQIVERELDELLTEGYVIDTVEREFRKIRFTLGTHPLPSEQNIMFTQDTLEKIKDLKNDDLVILVICGGGSALFESPYKASVEKLTEISKIMLNSGARIDEMNIVRKHLSNVKGGGLAKHLFPATIIGLIFSDVPGNDLAIIASGPTTQDSSTKHDVREILTKYQIPNEQIPDEILTELPNESKYFENIHNIVMLSNMTALSAMKIKANELGYDGFIYSDKVQGEAKSVGEKLIKETPRGKILLAGGETTVHVTGQGHGGRNQELVLSALNSLENESVIVSFDSDGVDFFEYAGAIGDMTTVNKAKGMGLDRLSFLDNNDSSGFFEKTGDGILTGKLESNVSDIMMVLKI